ncbi:MAG: hypothetical protein RLZZ128_1017, partial [Actinomycetota bacterium]
MSGSRIDVQELTVSGDLDAIHEQVMHANRIRSGETLAVGGEV